MLSTKPSNPLLEKHKAEKTSHYITPSMRREIYDYMSKDSVPLNPKHLTIAYGSTNHFKHSFDMYKDSKRAFSNNRKQCLA